MKYTQIGRYEELTKLYDASISEWLFLTAKYMTNFVTSRIWYATFDEVVIKSLSQNA